ncbi:glycosyltransferase [Irregularibacter muris]|uniref:Glycosyltransferase n=1 Tax=Irregularibacter muris TaxID=1796619 RepID=A0AAE3HH70_9FIRM|nr:glycosyltransferase [Irregularibacter muris]MCR1900086.1 glycosyltransferase [Irregularibacter muris]
MKNRSLFIDKVICYMLLFVTLIDSINGFLLRSSIDLPVSLSQFYKLIIILLVICRLTIDNKTSKLYLWLLSCFIFISGSGNYYFGQSLLDIAQSFLVFFKFFTIALIFYYFRNIMTICGLDKIKEIHRIFKYNYAVILANIVLGLLGLGFNSYKQGIGIKGFFYSGNEFSALFILFTAYFLYYIWNKCKNIYVPFSIFSIILGFMISTKVAIFGSVILATSVPLISGYKLPTFNTKKFARIGVFFLLMLALVVGYLANTELLHRWVYFYKKQGLAGVLLSGRNNFVKEAINYSLNEYNIFQFLFGGGSVQTVEMDLFDTLFNYGIFGFIIIISFWICIIYKSFILAKANKNEYAALIFLINTLLLIVASISGHVIYSGLIGIYIGLFNSLLYYQDNHKKSYSGKEKDKLRILLISNMFPSDKDPTYGVFVKNFKDGLEKEGVEFPHMAVICGKGTNIFQKIIKYLKFYYDIIKYGLSEDYDVIYAHYIIHSAIPLIFVQLFIDKPIILNAHGSDVIPIKTLSKYLQVFTKVIIKQSDLIVVPSEFFKEVVMDKFSVGKEKIYISPSSGIDVELFHEKDIMLPNIDVENKFIIGYVSRIDEGKGWDTYLQALYTLKKKQGIDFGSLVIGDGSQREDFLAKIEELGLQDKVLYLGRKSHEELADYYSMMDIFIFPTRRLESLGLVGVEAMACGTPVIGSNIGGLKGYIKDSDNGYLFEANNPIELYNKILQYYELNAHKKAEMKKNAKDTAQNYRSDIVVNKLYEKIYSFIKIEKN